MKSLKQKIVDIYHNKFVRIALFVLLSCLSVLAFVTTVSHFLIYNSNLVFFVFPYISLVGALYAMLFYGTPLFISTFKSMRQGNFINYDFMLSFAVLVAFITSTILWIVYGNDFTSVNYYKTHQKNAVFTFYDASILLLYFNSIGIYFQTRVVRSSKTELKSLQKFQVKKVKFYDVAAKTVKSILTSEVKVGDYLLIARGDYIPVDGTLYSKTALLETSIISGHDEAVLYKEDQALYSGMINLGNAFIMRVDKPLSESYVSHLVKKLESFSIKDSRIVNLANRFIRYVFLVEFVLALGFFLGYVIYGAIEANTFASFNTHLFVYYLVNKAIFSSLSLITAICPCGLGVTLPALVLVASYAAYKNKIIFRNLRFLNTIPYINAIAFDKTGTLSFSGLNITNLSYKDNDNFYLSLLKSIESQSNHPIALSVIKNFNATPTLPVHMVQEVVGNGLQATYHNKSLIIASCAYIETHYPNVTNLDQYKQRNLLVYDNEVVLGFDTQPVYKKDIYQVIDYFKAHKYETLLITGDQQLPASDGLWQIFLPKQVYFNVKPEGKAKILSTYALNNDSKVLYVGDGLNDVDAFKGSDISVALGSGQAVLQSVADVVLLDSDLKGLPYLFKMLNLAKWFIYGVFVWFFIYNIAVAFITGFALITPSLGAGLMIGSDIVLLIWVLIFRFTATRVAK